MSYHLSRSIVRRATRVPHRTFITVQFGANNSRWLLVLSGFAGGAVATVSGGYVLYRWSGLGDIVDKIRHVTKKSEQPTDSRNATVAQLFFGLRTLAKTYVAEIPGAFFLVDKAFDLVENIVDSHQEKARTVLEAAIKDIQDAVKARGEDTIKAAWDVLIILRDKLGQIQAIAPAINQIKIGPLFDSFRGFYEHASQRVPAVRDSLSSLLSASQKKLKEGKNLILQVSARRNSGSNSIPPAEEEISSSNPVEGKPSLHDEPSSHEPSSHDSSSAGNENDGNVT